MHGKVCVCVLCVLAYDSSSVHRLVLMIKQQLKEHYPFIAIGEYFQNQVHVRCCLWQLIAIPSSNTYT